MSVRHGASTSYASVRERCEVCPTTLSHGEEYILYAILDFIVDNYMPVLETIKREVEAIEDRVFAAPLATPRCIDCTRCGASFCNCATPPLPWPKSAGGSSMPR